MDEEPFEIEQQEQELYEHHRFAVDRGQEALRLDIYLQMRLSGVSRTKIQAAAKAGCIQVNDKAAKPSYKVKPQDVISVLLPEPPHEFKLTPEKIDFPIVYEDDEVLVIDKPAGLVVHPGVGNWTGTLVNGLLYYLGDKASPYLVHRIDKDTSGLLLVAKNDFSHVALSEQIKAHTVKRAYRAIVIGGFREDAGTVEGPIGRHPADRKRMAIVPGGREAVTHWTALEPLRGATLIEARLTTGRTHQIRVHMASVGHPVLGDPVYGPKKSPYPVEGGQLLHAFRLGFIHPRTGEPLLFEAEPEPRFTYWLEKLRRP